MSARSTGSTHQTVRSAQAAQTEWERAFVAFSLLLGEPNTSASLASTWTTFTQGERAARATRIAAEVALVLRDVRAMALT